MMTKQYFLCSEGFELLCNCHADKLGFNVYEQCVNGVTVWIRGSSALSEDMPSDTERKPDRTQKRSCWKSEHLALHCSYCAVRYHV